MSEEEIKTIDVVDLPVVVKEAIVEEAKNDGKKELSDAIKSGDVDGFKVDVKKWFLKSKVFWINTISLLMLILPEFLSYMLQNIEFASWLKEKNSVIYFSIIGLNAFLNITLRLKPEATLTLKKRDENAYTDDTNK